MPSPYNQERQQPINVRRFCVPFIFGLAITFIAVAIAAWFLGGFTTEAGALTQVDHVAARNLDRAKLRALVEKYVQGRSFRVFGEPHVNVLALNMALDAREAG